MIILTDSRRRRLLSQTSPLPVEECAKRLVVVEGDVDAITT